jgi:uncharacterized protein YgbK (DUF1537 family)
MICVFADDFTGAAEIGGIVWRFNLSAEIIYSTENYRGHPDFIIIDTDTRSRDESEVEEIITRILADILALKPSWIYKKTDSILRGHVLKELQILQKGFAKDRVVLVPAIPSFGRTIEHGIYYINGIPLEQTDFAKDPEYPRSSSNVADMLGVLSTDWLVPVRRNESLPPNGFIIGETSKSTDLEYFASAIDDTTIPAGGSEFFLNVLQDKKMTLKKRTAVSYTPGEKRLIVVGSSSEQSRKNLQNLKQKNVTVCTIPHRISESQGVPPGCAFHWSEEIVKMFSKNHHVAATINQPVQYIRSLTRDLADCMAQMVATVLEKVQIDEMIIEGGATASRIIRRLDWNHLRPEAELSPGIVVLHVAERRDFKLIVKPGSYPWPEILTQ